MERADWIDLAVAACDKADIDYGEIEIITTWDQKFSDYDAYRNNAVFRIGGQRCLKIYGPNSERQFQVERSVLGTLTAGNSSIPAPYLIAANERSQLPPYLIMTEVIGSTLEEGWATLTRTEQLAIAREIGVITTAIHGLPQEALAAVEQQVGGRYEYARQIQAERITQIEATKRLSTRQRNILLDYVLGEAQEFLGESPRLTHLDFSHAHIYITRETGMVKVSGFIDWAEAMLGPSEWDITYHWFWTLNQDHETMRECLRAFYPTGQLPDRFARRCLSTHLYSYSMGELWPYFAEKAEASESIVREMTAFFFPPDVFGPPD